MNLEKVGLFVLIAILVGGLATSPVFSSSYSAFAQSDDANVEQNEMEEAELAIQDAKEEIEKADMEITEASDDGKDTELSEDALDEAIEKLEMAEESFAAGNYEEAEELAEQAKDLASESRMTLIGKTVDDFEEHDGMDRPDEASDEMNDVVECTLEYAPVCGTDGKTYGNMCMLEASDTELAHEGECETDFEDDQVRDEMERDYDDDYYHDKLERYCEMSDEEKAEVESKYDKLTDEMKDRIAEYCSLSEDERDAYLETHHDMMMDFKERHHDMVDEMQDRHKEIRMQKMMERDFKITDERKDALKMKFKEKHSDLTDDERDDLRDDVRDRYTDHYKMKFKARHDALSDQNRDDLLKRHSEMRDYKAELRERHDAMTDEQRDKFRMDFYSNAKDMRHAWLTPHQQMTAGIGIDEIECREGLNLVMMNSNGKAMCMKSSTAEKLIQRGIVVPA